jgi:amino acid transporter
LANTKSKGRSGAAIRKAGLLSFVFVMYSYTTAGPFGLEDQVTTSGPGMTLIYHLVLPFFWCIPISLVAAELTTAMPVQGGFYRWTRAAFERIHQGQPPRTLRELLPGPKWENFADVLSISMLIACGLAHAPLSLGRLSILGTVAFLASGFALLCGALLSLEAECVDDILGVKSMAPEKMRFMRRVMTRAFATRGRLASEFAKRSAST